MSSEVKQVAIKLSHSGRFRKIILILVVVVLGLGAMIVPTEGWEVGDGLWFAITTVTGVGYGDIVPLTMLGRLMGALLQVLGVVLFGSIVAFVSVELLRYQEDFNMKRVTSRLDEQNKYIAEIKKRLDYLVKK